MRSIFTRKKLCKAQTRCLKKGVLYTLMQQAAQSLGADTCWDSAHADMLTPGYVPLYVRLPDSVTWNDYGQKVTELRQNLV